MGIRPSGALAPLSLSDDVGRPQAFSHGRARPERRWGHPRRDATAAAPRARLGLRAQPERRPGQGQRARTTFTRRDSPYELFAAGTPRGGAAPGSNSR